MSIRHACMVRYVSILLVRLRRDERHLVLLPARYDQRSEADRSAHNGEYCIEHKLKDSIV